MSKMRTTFGKGSKRLAVLMLTLLLTVGFIMAGATGALATEGSSTDSYARFRPYINGAYTFEGSGTFTMSAESAAKITSGFTLQSKKIFAAQSYSSMFRNVAAISVQSTDIHSGTAIKLKLNSTGLKDSNWKDKSTAGNKTRFDYQPSKKMSYSTFNNLMSHLSVYFDASSGATSARGTITVTAYSSKNMEDASIIRSTNSYTTKDITSYACTLVFYSYAEGAIETSGGNAPVVDYKNEYADNWEQDYDTAVPQNTATAVAVNPTNSQGGKVSFTLRITDGGGVLGANEAEPAVGATAYVGYQFKESTKNWDGTVTKYWLKDPEANTYDVSPVTRDVYNTQFNYDTWQYERVKVGTEIVSGTANYSVKLWTRAGETPVSEMEFPVTIEGKFDAGKTYQIRGLIATDGQEDSPRETNVITFRYDPPNISAFQIGSVDTAYKGGTGYMNVSATVTFADTNYSPDLLAELYFTPSLTQSNSQDSSKWYKVKDKETNSDKRNWPISWSGSSRIDIPAKLEDITNYVFADSTGTALINTDSAAFKLVITDRNTGFASVAYSKPFTVDSQAPEGLAVTAKVGSKDITLDAQPQAAPVKVGGSDAQVKIHLGSAYDPGFQKVSNGNLQTGIRSYEYAYYFISTDDTANLPAADKASDLAILTFLKNQNGGQYYTDWSGAAASTASRTFNGNTYSVTEGEFTVAKDGYYRVLARVTDNADQQSAVIERYFRVDLSPPSQPKVYLAMIPEEADAAAYNETTKKYNPTLVKNYDFQYYDNSAYSTDHVWLFARSDPKTGKTLESFEYSVNGGLTWVNFVPAGMNSSNNLMPKVFKDNTNASYAPLTTMAWALQGDTAATSSVANDFQYQIGVALSTQGIDDYKSIIVRATDTLGNTSPASQPIVMRTIAALPKTTASITHSSVEIALAVGNSVMSVSQVTPALKNQVAIKINSAYYGASSTEVTSWIGSHLCTWNNDNCEGSCLSGASCPYVQHPELFSPNSVVIQGMAEAKTAELTWTRFDHTNYNVVPKNDSTAYVENSTRFETKTAKNGTHVDNYFRAPTVAYTEKPVVGESISTTLQGNPDYPTHTIGSGASAVTLYTAPRDRVVYTGQTTNDTYYYKKDGVEYIIPQDDDTNASSGAADTYSNIIVNQGVHIWREAESNGVKYQMPDTYEGAGRMYPVMNWDRDGPIIGKRIYHIIDYTLQDTTVGGTVNSATDNVENSYTAGSSMTWTYTDRDGVPLEDSQNKFTKFAAYDGYWYGSLKDFLFVNNDSPTRKEIYFTINDNDVNSHAADGHGFLFNSTIRQSKEDGHRWLLSGHMLYLGFSAGNTPTSLKMWVLRLTDVDVENWVDGVGSNGYAKEDMGLILSGASSDGARGAGGKDGYSPTGGGRIDVVAYSPMDVTSKQTRNYKLVCEGNWTSMYVWTSAGQTNTSIVNRYNTDSKNNTTTVNGLSVSRPEVGYLSGIQSAGFKTIKWYDKFGSTNQYSNSLALLKINGSAATELTPVGNDSDGTYLYTPRPKVDGEYVGMNNSDTRFIGAAATTHTDTNCYGLGPLSHGRSWGHGCARDSRVIFSNVDVKFVQAKDLSEVVTEPSWGNGKAKFIANISDDSVDDFKDPVLTAQIQWRINNDNTRYIGWGNDDNRAETLSFLNRILGKTASSPTLADVADAGYYEESKQWKAQAGATGENAKYASNHLVINQIQNIADYITGQYYSEFGYTWTGSSSTPVKDQLSPTTGITKGQVYDLDDIESINFSVTPSALAESSANPDFPAGRWYMVHDIKGYEFATSTPDARSGQFSDALDTKITLPGRYTFYFAPSVTDIENNTLDPDKAVFDFVVNSSPKASFSAEMKVVKTNGSVATAAEIAAADTDAKKNSLEKESASYLAITESAYDPDVGINNRDAATNKPKARNATYYNDEHPDIGYNSRDVYYTVVTDPQGNVVERVPHKITYNDVDISGITKVEYRWELLVPDSSGGLKTVKSSAWSETDLPNGKTINQLSNSQFSRYLTLDQKAVFTVYERVTDVSARRVAKKNANGEFIGYEYQQISGGSKTSQVYQANVGSAGAQATNPPSAAIALNQPYIYDTAEGDSALLTVTRNSFHTQGNTFALLFKYGLGSQKAKEFKVLTENTTTHDWYIPNYFTDATAATNAGNNGNVNLTVLKYIGNQSGYSDHALKVGTGTINITTTDNSVTKTFSGVKTSTGGIWQVPKDTVRIMLGNETYKDQNSGLIIQALESAWGYSASDIIKNGNTINGLSPKNITDQSSRTIYFKTDKGKPSSPVINTRTFYNSKAGTTVTVDGVTKDYADVGDSYSASGYLDVTLGYNQINVSGAKDKEGALGGYAYYFYDKNANGTIKQYVKFDAVETSSGSGVYVLKKKASDSTATTEAAATVKIPVKSGNTDAPFSLRIGPETIRQEPTDSLNVAIYAYDTQTTANQASGANTTAVTKIEDIKLSKSKPMPTAITVKNATTDIVSQVTNNVNAAQDVAVSGDKDSMSTGKKEGKSLNYFANSAVTVEFAPKKAKYDLTKTNAQGRYDLDSSGTESYVDIYGQPDLTATANIRYSLQYASNRSEGQNEIFFNPATQAGQQGFTSKGLSANDFPWPGSEKTVSPSTVLNLSVDGYYKLTATVINGSGTLSESRSVSFIIDKTAPSEPVLSILDENKNNYNTTTSPWAKNLSVDVSGSDDVYPNYYEFTLDGGTTWYPLGDMNYTQSFGIPSDATNQKYDSNGDPINIVGGEFQVRIKAVDEAGNETVTPTKTLRVDREGPEVPKPVVEAGSSATPVYQDYLVSLVYNSSAILEDEDDDTNDTVLRNTVKSIQTVMVDDGNGNETETQVTKEDTEVIVPRTKSVRLEFWPRLGQEFSQVTVGGIVYDTETDDTQTDDNNNPIHYLVLENVVSNMNVSVTFVALGTVNPTANLARQGTLLAKAAGKTLLQDTSLGGIQILSNDDEPTVTPMSAGEDATVTVQLDGGGAFNHFGMDPVFTADVGFEKKGSVYETVTGAHVAATFTPLAGYEVKKVTLNGVDLAVTPNSGSYVFNFDVVEVGSNILTLTIDPLPMRNVRINVSDPELVDSVGLEGKTASSADGLYHNLPEGSGIVLKVEPKTNYAVNKIVLRQGGEIISTEGDGTADLDLTGGRALTIPAYTGEGTAPTVEIDVEVDVSAGVEDESVDTVEVNIIGEGTVTPGLYEQGAIEGTRTGTVKVIAGQSRSFTLTPAKHYELLAVSVVAKELNVGTEESFAGNYSETSPGVYGLTLGTGNLGGNGVFALKSMTVEFARKTHSIGLSGGINGTVSYQVDDGEIRTSSSGTVPEGAKLTIRVTPDSDNGYRVENVVIRHNGKTYTPGAVSTYEIPSVQGPVEVSATYIGQSNYHLETEHSITARAEKVSDGGAQIDSSTLPYRFCLRPGLESDPANDVDTQDYSTWDWTDWTSEYVMTFQGTYTYNKRTVELQPNTAYTVFVQARDSVLNPSDPVGETVYTHANTPTVLFAVNYDDKSGSTTLKSVLIDVDTNGNPAYTEYQVYYSTDATMDVMDIAKTTRDGDTANYPVEEDRYWDTLDNMDRFQVKGLDAGATYYFAIVARNKDKIPTELNTNNYVFVTLSPAAPATNSLYVLEPASPAAPIELKWEDIPADVQGLQFYRDDTFLDEIVNDGSVNSFIDPEPYQNFADKIVTYSYAYVNSSGVGNLQTAVTQEYYNAWKTGRTVTTEADPEEGTEEEYTYKEDEAGQKLQKMDAAKTSANNPDLFTEILTYPRFPLRMATNNDINSNIRATMGSTADSARIDLSMKYDSSIMRYQNYGLYLRVFEDNDAHTEVTTTKINEWDPHYRYHDAGTTKQKPNYTEIRSEYNTVRARAAWEQLSNNFLYQICVQEITTTGFATASGYHYGQNENPGGVESYLGKTYFVNAKGYGYRYVGANRNSGTVTIDFLDVPTGNEAGDNTKGVWTEEEKLAYTSTVPWSGDSTETAKNPENAEEIWDTPIHEGYISFNKSANIQAAGDGTALDTARNAAKRHTDALGNSYILVDKGDEENHDERFEVNVWAWDEDGAGGDGRISVNAYVADTAEATSGLNGSTTLPTGYVMPRYKDEDDVSKHTGADAADTAKLKPLTISFNGSGQETGVYRYLNMSARDGVSTNTTQDSTSLKLVVNHNIPSITINGGLNQQREVDTPLAISDLVQYTSSIGKEPATVSDEALSKVVLLVLETVKEDGTRANYFEEKFGEKGSDYDTLHGWLVTAPVAEKVELAKKMIEAAEGEVDAKYLSGTGLSEDGFHKAILSAAPPVEMYVQITADQYTAMKAAGKDVLLDEGSTADTNFYWMNLEEAVKEDVNRATDKLCPWLEYSSGNNTVTPKFVQGEDVPLDDESTNKHAVKLVASVGNNTIPDTAYITVKNQPSAKIQSSKYFGWTDVIKGEYDYITSQSTSIGDMIRTYSEKGAIPADITFDKINEDDAEEDRPTATSFDISTPAARVDPNNSSNYQAYKLVDRNGIVNNQRIIAKLKIELGINNSMSMAGIIFSKNRNVTLPTTKAELKNTDTMLIAYAGGSNDDNVSLAKNTTYNVVQSGLESSTLYYMWPFYQLPGGELVVASSEEYDTLTTTESYEVVYYGFGEAELSRKESEFSGNANGLAIPLLVEVQGSTLAAGYVDFSVTYYKADEYGNFVDSENKPLPADAKESQYVPITGDQLTRAKETLTFDWTESGTEGVWREENLGSASSSTSVDKRYVNIRVKDNDKEQGHMIARLHMEAVDPDLTDSYYIMITNGCADMDIFIQDDESEVTSYSIGAVNPTGTVNKNNVMGEEMNVAGTAVDYYTYQLPGMQVGQPLSDENSLTVTYINTGTGDLTEITAAVYQDNNGVMSSTPSTDFVVSAPRVPTLLVRQTGAVGTVQVRPDRTLTSGDYYGWLVITAKHVDNTQDRVRVRLHQIVGNTTLTGRIYITTREPDLNEETGKATIYLYDYNKINFAGTAADRENSLAAALVAYTETDELGNFTINNILNGTDSSNNRKRNYQIRVVRDGFVSYDTTGSLNPILSLGGYTVQDALTFDRNIRLYGGDVDGDGQIRQADVNVLGTHYNQILSNFFADEDASDEEKARVAANIAAQNWADPEKELAILKRCDFNGDGIINALDRSYVVSNLSFNGYKYTALSDPRAS